MTDTQTVTVAQTGAVTPVTFKKGMTVTQALKASGITVGSGRSVRLNGNACIDKSTKLRANDVILIVGRIRGA